MIFIICEPGIVVCWCCLKALELLCNL